MAQVLKEKSSPKIWNQNWSIQNMSLLDLPIKELLEIDYSKNIKNFTKKVREKIENDPYTAIRLAAVVGFTLGGSNLKDIWTAIGEGVQGFMPKSKSGKQKKSKVLAH